MIEDSRKLNAPVRNRFLVPLVLKYITVQDSPTLVIVYDYCCGITALRTGWRLGNASGLSFLALASQTRPILLQLMCGRHHQRPPLIPSGGPSGNRAARCIDTLGIIGQTQLPEASE